MGEGRLLSGPPRVPSYPYHRKGLKRISVLRKPRKRCFRDCGSVAWGNDGLTIRTWSDAPGSTGVRWPSIDGEAMGGAHASCFFHKGQNNCPINRSHAGLRGEMATVASENDLIV